MRDLTPKDHAEAVATFRHAVIGPVCARELSHGELAEALRSLTTIRFRPPGSKLTTTYSVPTLERWLYAYRQGGLDALDVDGMAPMAKSVQERADHLFLPEEAVPVIVVQVRRDDGGALSVALLQESRRAAPCPGCPG